MRKVVPELLIGKFKENFLITQLKSCTRKLRFISNANNVEDMQLAKGLTQNVVSLFQVHPPPLLNVANHEPFGRSFEIHLTTPKSSSS